MMINDYEFSTGLHDSCCNKSRVIGLMLSQTTPPGHLVNHEALCDDLKLGFCRRKERWLTCAFIIHS